MLDILKDKDKDLLIESILEKLTQRRRDVYGPSARMWSYLEGINSSRDKIVNADTDTCSKI